MRFALAVAAVLCAAQALYAQPEDLPADAQIQEQPPEVQAELEAQPSAMPADDVMKPTENVVRFTPKMARGMAKQMAGEFQTRDLPEDQRREFEERLARRMMKVGHQHGQDLVPFFQTLFGEMMASQSEKITPENAPRIGELARKAAPAIRTFADGLAEDARPYLSPDDYQELLAEEEKMKRAADRVEEEMARWSRGELPEGEKLENPFEIMEDAIENDGELPEQTPDGRSNVRRELDRQAEWSYWQKTPQGWQWFLQRVRRTCDFTDEQFEQGQAILKEYEKRAKEIMTPEWKKRIQRNRLLFQSQHRLKDQRTEEIKTDDGQSREIQVPVAAENIEPWLFQINVEFDKLTAPLDEMKIQFTHDIMNLATPEQREAVAAELRTLAAAHGMEQAMVEAVIAFLFPAPEPAEPSVAGDESADSASEAEPDPSSEEATPVSP